MRAMACPAVMYSAWGAARVLTEHTVWTPRQVDDCFISTRVRANVNLPLLRTLHFPETDVVFAILWRDRDDKVFIWATRRGKQSRRNGQLEFRQRDERVHRGVG